MCRIKTRRHPRSEAFLEVKPTETTMQKTVPTVVLLQWSIIVLSLAMSLAMFIASLGHF